MVQKKIKFARNMSFCQFGHHVANSGKSLVRKFASQTSGNFVRPTVCTSAYQGVEIADCCHRLTLS